VGLIPTLEDDGWILSESHAILRYLSTREDREDLFPSDLRQRAAVDEFLERWSAFFRPTFHRHESAALGYTLQGGLRSRDPDEAEADRIAREIAPILHMLDELVSPAGAVLGRFTIADCAVAPILNRTLHSGLDLGGYPALAALRERLLSRLAFSRAGPII
jgi:glutathione S-transferase